MRITSLETTGFRNLGQWRLEPCPAINVICGENGQGKTNLLEAAGLFNGMRSFRGARNNQLIAHGEKFARLELGFFAAGREQTAKMIITPESREVTVNGVKQPSAASMIGRFCTVIFSPDRMTLVSGGAAERRKFIDAAISQLRPRFAASLVEYNRVLNQRNNLLRDIYRTGRSDTLEVWDSALASLGAKISAERASFAARLDAHAAGIYEGIAAGREPMRTEYACSYSKSGDYENDFYKALCDGRDSDIKAGFTQRGPQRDDLEIYIGGKSARNFGSQGQKRSAVLALKLAEAKLLSDVLGEQPVALLDDVMSELDTHRQSYLLNRLEGWQVFITCCDPATLRLLDKGSVFEMAAGDLQINDEH